MARLVSALQPVKFALSQNQSLGGWTVLVLIQPAGRILSMVRVWVTRQETSTTSASFLCYFTPFVFVHASAMKLCTINFFYKIVHAGTAILMERLQIVQSPVTSACSLNPYRLSSEHTDNLSICCFLVLLPVFGLKPLCLHVILPVWSRRVKCFPSCTIVKIITQN